MQFTIRTQNAQRKINVESHEEIEQRIKNLYKIDSFDLFSDFEKTKPLAIPEIQPNSTIFMNYEMGEIKTHQPEFKCTHSPDAVCPKCVNIDKIDKAFTPGKKVKYLSYLSYLQALDDKSLKKETYDYVIKKCEEHPENQKCSKCMDRQITLVPQPYRYIDYVEFDSKGFLESFISEVKSSGRQQVGLLIGKIADCKDIPLGKKAVVSGIWQIDQEKYPDGVVLNEIPSEFYSKDLSILGVIYTDLIYKNKEITSSKVIGNYQISTLEIDFIASLAIKYNNKAFFGVCVSVNDEKNIEPQVFMISEQYEALIKANALGTTTDPQMFISNRDIVYFINNEYDKKVSKKADPLLPVYYFVITCEVGFNENPLFTKNILLKKPKLSCVAGYFQNDYSFENFKSFNVLCVLKHFIPTLISDLFSAVIKNDENLFNRILQTPEFGEFKETLGKFQNEKWNCSECTYLNEAYKTNCEMCGSQKL